MKSIPLALVIFEAPEKIPARDVARLGVEIESWHLSTLPLVIDFMHPVPLASEAMRLLREHLRADLQPQAVELVLKELGPLGLTLEDYRVYWGEADDWHFGTVVLLFVLPPSAPLEEFQKILDRNEIRPFHRRTS